MKISFPTPDQANLFSIKKFIWKQKERILAGIAVAIVGVVFLAKGVTGKDRLLQDYFRAGVLQAKCKMDKKVDIADLTALLKKHPELKPCFGSYLEQEYVLQGDLKLAQIVSSDSLKRISFVSPLYLEYAKNSLLIEEGKYEEALGASAELEKRIDKLNSSNLYGLNRVRISFLQNILHKDDPSSAKWDEIKTVVSGEIYSHLSDEHISLIDVAPRIIK